MLENKSYSDKNAKWQEKVDISKTMKKLRMYICTTMKKELQ